MDLQQAIQEAVETRVFSVEGVQAIQTLKQNFSKLTDDYAKALVERNKANELATSLATQNEGLVAKVSEVRNRELAVEKREKEITRLEIKKECADELVRHTLGMFNTVFANATLKNSILREVVNPSTYGSGPGCISTAMIKDKVSEDTSREVGG